MKQTLNVLLAKTDYLAKQWSEGLKDFIRFFKTNQGAFKGEKKTYNAKAGTVDMPSERGFRRIVTTVDEKFQWLEETFSEYFDALFSQEKTNATGSAKAKLVVDNIDFGELTTLELLKLKSTLENNDLINMYSEIPVRPDDRNWTETAEEDYRNRKTVFESELNSGTRKTTEKTDYILPDPNIEKLQGAKYTPQVAQRSEVVELGEYTHQYFTGEYSHRQRAEILRRRAKLLVAVIEALKVANEVEAVESALTGKKIFDYLHRGQ